MDYVGSDNSGFLLEGEKSDPLVHIFATRVPRFDCGLNFASYVSIEILHLEKVVFSITIFWHSTN